MNRSRDYFAGFILVALGVCLILWKLGFLNFKFTFFGVGWFWGIVAICLVFVAVNSLLQLSFGGVFFPVAIICIIFAKPWHLTAITPWPVIIAACLLTAGFEHFFPNRSGKGSFLSSRTGYESDSNYAYFSLKMGESAKYFRDESLEEVDLAMSLGSMSVYFDNVSVPNGVIKIHTKTSLGETNLYIPKGWKIVNNIKITAGDCSFKGLPDASDENSVQCFIDGSVFCGDTTIERV